MTGAPATLTLSAFNNIKSTRRFDHPAGGWC